MRSRLGLEDKVLLMSIGSIDSIRDMWTRGASYIVEAVLVKI